MSLGDKILDILTDGQRHSGVALGRALGVTRAAISKAVREMADVPVSVDRMGYALPETHRPLDAVRIREIVSRHGVALDQLIVLSEVDSTNRYLLQRPDADRTACLAERQTQGRGRRGRQWVADPYSNILLSVVAHVPGGARALGVLSLAAGVAVHRALGEIGVADVALKWPNDVLYRNRKLAGILTEVRGEAEAPRAVIGVGLNCYLSAHTGAEIDQPWASLDEQLIVDRSVLVGHLVAHLFAVIDACSRGEGAALVAAWRERHAYAGQHVALLRDAGTEIAMIKDIDDEGALVVRIGDREEIVHSGEVRLRPL